MRRGVGADEPLINGLPAGSDKVLIGLVSANHETLDRGCLMKRTLNHAQRCCQPQRLEKLSRRRFWGPHTKRKIKYGKERNLLVDESQQG
jgi:hypothetical protein